MDEVNEYVDVNVSSPLSELYVRTSLYYPGVI